jgi:hypothetical protein
MAQVSAVEIMRSGGMNLPKTVVEALLLKVAPSIDKTDNCRFPARSPEHHRIGRCSGCGSRGLIVSGAGSNEFLSSFSAVRASRFWRRTKRMPTGFRPSPVHVRFVGAARRNHRHGRRAA